MNLTRRRALTLGLGTIAGISVSAGCATKREQDVQAVTDDPKREFAIAGNASLTQRATAKGFFYGAAGNYPVLSKDAKFAALFAQQCGILVPENEMKWQPLCPAPDRYDFTQADWLVNFARSHNMPIRGHTLVWNQAIPDWFKETVNRQNAEQTMVRHIQAVMGHYAGKIHSWDVVNEAIAVPYSNRSDGLQSSPWLEFLGSNYIDLAFRVAAEADPKALLVHNEGWMDYDTQRDNAQRAAVLGLLERLKRNKVPIHALGIQAHLNASETKFNPNRLRQFLQDVASMGLKDYDY